MTPQQLGGLAVKNRLPPKCCPRCGADFWRKNYHQFLGHMGLHGYADRYFCGNISMAAQRLARNGLAAQDPFPQNGVFKHKPVTIFKPKGTPMKTDFSLIEFNQDKHRYVYCGRELTPVTTIIKNFQKPFDREAVAQRVAKRENRHVAEVLSEWKAKGERSRILGTQVHEYIEGVLRGENNGQVSFDSFLSLCPKLPEIVAFDKLWSNLAPTVSWCKEHIEYVIGDISLGVAGTVDSMLFSPKTGKYHIWDWKTGNFDLHNRFDNLLGPFSKFDASKLHIYSLQVSLYRLIVELNTDLELGDSYIAHISESGAQIHRVIDFREPLLAYLEELAFPI